MKLIGIFMLMCIISVAMMIGYLVKSKFNTNETTVVMYFEESVKGLEVGSPVLFKGVKIGQVSNINLTTNLKTMEFSIKVIAKLDTLNSNIIDKETPQEKLDIFIKSGLRAQLAVNSIITGQLLIELNLFKDTIAIIPPHPKGQLVIPTISSPFAKITNSLKVMPLAKISQDVYSITETLSTQLPSLINNMDETLNTVNTILAENQSSTAQMVKDIGNSANSINLLVNENSANISQLLESVTNTSNSIKNLTDYLQIYPNSVVFGKE